jgi:two-component system phosphate regulon sensor histidine kinase PhoR
MTTPETPPDPSGVETLLRRSAAPLLFALAGGLLAGFVFNRVLDHAIAGRTEAGAFALLARAGPEVEAVLAAKQDPKGTIEQLGRQLSLRATLIGSNGRVLGDSGVERSRIDSLENHAGRPEVQEAFRLGTGVRRRYSSTVADRLVYVAARLRGGEVLRLAFPEKDLAEWEAPFRRQTLGLSTLAGLLVAALLIRARSRHAAELGLVRRAVAAVERGERPPNPGPVSDGTAAVFSALGDLADLVSGRDAGVRRDAAASRAIFEEVPVGLLVVDPRLSLLDANAEAVRLFGAEPGTMRPGEHVLELVRERSVPDLLDAALKTGRATATLRLASERGGRSLEASAVRIAEGATSGHPAAIAILRETPSPRPE